MSVFSALLRDESGATAVEYGLVAGLIAVAAITAMGVLGNSQSSTFRLVADHAANASGGGQPESPDPGPQYE
jgi:pilus assembly protein Flp/PilA